MEAGATQRYEFGPGQNELIDGLAKKMSWVAWFLLALAVIGAIIGVMTLRDQGLGNILQGVLLIIVAVWTRRAAAAFQRIVQTEGSDISNLMDALGELKKLYTLQFWLLLIAGIIVVFALIVGVGAITANAL